MTYLTFHLLWIVPPLLLMAWLARQELQRSDRRPLLALGVLCLLAFCYTTPWDNYLVYRQIWGYGSERVWATLGYVPLEEYLFFILQTLLSGCLFLAWAKPRTWKAEPASTPARAAWAVACLLLLGAVGSLALLWQDQTLYLGLILAWALPILALQIAVGGDQLWRRAGAVYVPVMLSTLYLWLSDFYAIGAGIWFITDAYILPWRLGGILPLEEMLFFGISNLMVCQGLSLFLDPVIWQRLQSKLQPRKRAPKI